MLNKSTETYVVVIACTPCGKGNYAVELSGVKGDILELTVHEEVVLDYRLVVGKELDLETFELLKNSKDYQHAYRYAIQILARRMYTQKELERKLSKREVSLHITQDVVAKLLEIELLNDDLYAKTYIEEQVGSGRKTRKRIVHDLFLKGVSEDIIDDYTYLFDQTSETEMLVREITKICGGLTFEELNDFKFRDKVIRKLGNKGFDFAHIRCQYDFFVEDFTVDHDKCDM